MPTEQLIAPAWAAALVALLTGIWIVADAAPRASAQVDLADLYQQQIEALNGGDLDAALAFYTDDAVFQGPGCVPTCVGPEAIGAVLQNSLDANVQVTIVSIDVSGSTASGQEEVTGDIIQGAGYERVIRSFVLEFTGEKISSVLITPDLTDQQTADFLAFQQAQQGLPTTGSGATSTVGSAIPSWWYALAAAGVLLVGIGFLTRGPTQGRP